MRWKADDESGALIGCAFGIYRAAEFADDSVDNGQAQAAAGMITTAGNTSGGEKGVENVR